MRSGRGTAGFITLAGGVSSGSRTAIRFRRRALGDLQYLYDSPRPRPTALVTLSIVFSMHSDSVLSADASPFGLGVDGDEFAIYHVRYLQHVDVHRSLDFFPQLEVEIAAGGGVPAGSAALARIKQPYDLDRWRRPPLVTGARGFSGLFSGLRERKQINDFSEEGDGPRRETLERHGRVRSAPSGSAQHARVFHAFTLPIAAERDYFTFIVKVKNICKIHAMNGI
ncbi:hypothetical protein EVAR_41841_1 [Eumeta japonica]|uniref:Uncharacterized protein n=1 Tax=Eumeta variegata TaxID=151549 RepID=A0A4C1X8M2_EUMVA|nr:hypothetical protein EVAR_41841_1 [Eumeta japonica]